jgi:hypothetical protein
MIDVLNLGDDGGVDAALASPGRDYNVLVCDDGERILGYICFGPTPMTMGTWDLYWIAVDRSQHTVIGGVGYSLFRGFIMGSSDMQSLGPTICEDFYFPYARKIWGPRELAGSPTPKNPRISKPEMTANRRNGNRTRV